MRLNKSIIIGLGILTLAITLHAQSISTISELAPDSIVQVTAEAEGLSPVDPATLPLFAGCWWTVYPGGGPVPMPCQPLDLSVPIYEIIPGIYLVDQTGGAVSVPRAGGMQAMTSTAVAAAVDKQGNAITDLIEQVQETEFEQTMAMSFGMEVPTPGEGESEGGGTNYFGASFSIPDYGTNLWIAQTRITNGSLAGIGTNTLAAIKYEIQSRTNLAQTDWQSEGFILGSQLTNWTPLSVAQNGRTNLFIRLRSWIDSANIGIPDWWQIQYFGQVGIDPYSSPSGDGYSLYYKYQNGLNPTNFLAPPAPGNFYAMLSTNGTDILLSWSATQGAVSNYIVSKWIYNPSTYDYDYSTIVVNANANSFADIGAINIGDDDGNDFYGLIAAYPDGHNTATAYSYVYHAPPPATVSDYYNVFVSAKLIRNQTGRWQLMFSGLPDNVKSINLIWTDNGGNSATQNILPTALTNGVYQIPDADAVSYLGTTNSVQGVGLNDEPGPIMAAGVLTSDAPYFVDGREHMKQNLEFLVRGASKNRLFFASHFYGRTFSFWPFGLFTDANTENFNQYSTNFEEFSFLDRGIQLDNLWPFTANYDLANYFVNPTRTNSLPFGSTNFIFHPDFSVHIPAPAILDHGDPYWILQPAFDPTYNSVGITTTNWAVTVSSTQTVASLANNSYNLFGLPYLTGCVVDMKWNGVPNVACVYQALLPGNSVTAQSGYLIGDYASWCPAPTFQPTNYFFAAIINQSPSLNAYPTPLNDGAFNVTNQTSPLVIAGVGEPAIVGGWVKYAVQNGSTPTGKYAYLGQYFVTNAILLDSSGNATTNSAGILSPYGEFFPTQAGKARLVTMPDIDPPYQQGTCTVSVVSLNVDANHDGTMDLSYFGPDQTSQSKPYVFWCNNDFDRLFHDADDDAFYEDGVETGYCPLTPYTPTFDANYRDANQYRVIPTQRDLEDFSRLWLTGVTTNLLAALPTGSTVTLSWGSISEGSPTIDLFKAADADGGMGYLTNSTVAAQQVDRTLNLSIGRLAPGDSLTLNSSLNPVLVYGSHYIWCGVTSGSGQLTLSFKDGNGNLLGQASVYIQIKDIKQMYERWTLGENPSREPTATAVLAEDGLASGESKFAYGPAATNTPYILFVHGWNMKITDKNIFAETAFKRLWWQGYQGRFGSFRWPTDYDFTGGLWDLAVEHKNFDNSEFNAWKSGVGLKNMLTRLNILYTNNIYLMAHSMGNIVAGEALKQAGVSRLVNTYVAMQAAVSAHCYDATTANRVIGLQQPDRYAFYWTNGAACYFNGTAGAQTYVNFLNANDFALSKWKIDQGFKPDTGYGYDSYLGAFTRGTVILTELHFPQDTYEIFAYADPAWSYALGAQVNVHGVFTGSQIDLQNVWGTDPFGQHDFHFHFWHSAQFRADNAMQINFWKSLLEPSGFNLK